MHSRSTHPVGLIAGQGLLPVIVARGMRAAGKQVCCVGLHDQFDVSLPGECDCFKPAGLIQIGKWVRTLRKWDVREAVMVGGVKKTRMHDPLKIFRQLPDWRAGTLWYRKLRHDRRNKALLAAVADELASCGITIIDSTTYIADQLAVAGVMTRTQPSTQQQADIDFGWPLLKQAVDLHIGQSMAVRDRDVIAVEAVEGTAEMIARAGVLCRAKGWTLLKTAASDHDMRADVPSVGVQTIEQLAAAGAGCLALGAGGVILIDKQAVLAAADANKIAVVGHSSIRESIVIDVTTIRSASELHRLLAAALRLPNYYGHNWDAFDECIHDEDLQLPRRIVIRGFVALTKNLPRDAEILADISHTTSDPALSRIVLD